MSLVEYYDPDGLFPLIQPHLQRRLPLRNLHWKSPARPVRSIATLHVDFIKASAGATNDAEAEGRDSVSILGGSQSQVPGRVQRHQIPGLRASPYLKLYLLKCDDKETYKASARKAVREWLREHPSSQDNHDAFEWLIVHVVLPDTQAASEARWSRSSGSGDETPKQKSTGASRWTGRGSSTILEKLRSDFNHSSKTAPDRVTQVRLTKDDLSAADAIPPQIDDDDGAWSDVIAKFKTLVLMSFSSRVAQYEDDVRQKDSQRALPGWNFCTFFVLKEGLGLAFENVGLNEDAMALYDELSAGLDTTIAEHAQRDGENHGSDFLPYSPDLEKAFRSAINRDASAEIEEAAVTPLSASLKPYRDLIVSNNISVFDIKSYIFARQMALLLRLASPTVSQSSSREDPNAPMEDLSSNSHQSRPLGEIEDPLPLVMLCQRATTFSASMGRLMRKELLASVSGAADIESPSQSIEDCASQMVLSWSFAVARQVLIETASPSFPSAPGSNAVSITARPDFFPSRRSSLPPAAHKTAPVTAKTVYEDDIFSNTKEIQAMQPLKNIELSNAAAHRADVYLYQRRILEKAGRMCGLDVTNVDSTEVAATEQTHEHLADEHGHVVPSGSSANARGFSDAQLRNTFSSIKSFRAFYRVLSDHAAWNYIISSRKRAAEGIHADMAILKFQERDFAAAAGYFNRLINAYSKSNWQSIESKLLVMHAQCLKTLNRRDEHLRILTTLLAKAAATQQARKQPSVRQPRDKASSMPDISTLLAETVAASRALPYEFPVPMMKYFDQAEVNRYITLSEGSDGFQMALTLHQSLVDRILIDSIKVQLVNKDGGQTKDVWLESNEPFELDATPREVWVSCKISTLGAFVVAKVIATSGKIAFTHELMKKPEVSTPLKRLVSPSADASSVSKQRTVQCYPRNGSLTAEIHESPLVWIGKQRRLEITISSGSNNVINGNIVIRASTAGLRLFTADASSETDAVKLTPSTKPGTMEFGSLEASTSFNVTIPWDLERHVPEIAFKLEIEYTTSQGTFTTLLSAKVEVDLAIDVNVQDLFKESALVSQFLLKPIRASPIHILHASLSGSDDFDVVPTTMEIAPVTAYRNEPACMTCKVHRRQPSASAKDASTLLASPQLPLRIEYRLVSQDVADQATNLFSHALTASPYAEVIGLLVPTFTARLHALFTEASLETAGLLAEFSLPSFDLFTWPDILSSALPPTTSAAIEQWLRTWHTANAIIALSTPDTDPDYVGSESTQRLGIDFEVPGVDYLFTAALSLDDTSLTGVSSDKAPLPRIATVGEPLAASISIRHTRAWSRSLTPPSAPASSPDEPSTFVYTLIADANTWLVAGPRRATFALAKGDSCERRVLLVPLRPGWHVLPSIEVALAPSPPPASSTSASTSTSTSVQATTQPPKPTTATTPSKPTKSTTPAPVSAPASAPAPAPAPTKHQPAAAPADPICETDCTTQNELVLVIEGMRSTTVGIGSTSAAAVAASGRGGDVLAAPALTLMESDAMGRSGPAA